MSLTIIVNDLSAVFEPAVALKSKLDVVSPLTVGAVPVIAPVLEFIDNPLGKEPDKTE